MLSLSIRRKCEDIRNDLVSFRRIDMTETKPTDSKRSSSIRQTTLTDFGFPAIQTCLNLLNRDLSENQQTQTTPSSSVFNHVKKESRRVE